jgi:hypothetical protein
VQDRAGPAGVCHDASETVTGTVIVTRGSGLTRSPAQAQPAVTVVTGPLAQPSSSVTCRGPVTLIHPTSVPESPKWPRRPQSARAGRSGIRVTHD